jgi:hypothetical protein
MLNRSNRRWLRLIAALAVVSCAACKDDDSGPDEVRPPGSEPTYTEEREPCADRTPLRNLYWGDLHIHTENSFDAYAFGVRNSPADAYRFARGEPLSIPPLDENGEGTRTVQLDRPLDFAAVTDHSEYLGEVQLCHDSDADAYDTARCEEYRAGGRDAVVSFGIRLAGANPSRWSDVCGEEGERCRSQSMTTWERIQQAADDAYDRSESCEFTSMLGYEYTGSLSANALHRNVIFRNEVVPETPISVFEEYQPWDMWRALDNTCGELDGCEVLAIPHNANQSAGTMFMAEYPDTEGPDEEAAAAAFRSRIEPLFEIYQHKGSQECRNGLSGILGAPDEFCGFEKIRAPETSDCGDGTGVAGLNNAGCISRRNFWRNVLVEGLREEERIGENPFKLGVVSGTDTHNATSGYVDEEGWKGHIGNSDSAVEDRLGGNTFTTGGIVTSPGGLTGVWAVENSRDAIFEALKRREVYATSGPRMSVRFFGGWGLDEDLCGDPKLIEEGYRKGVPMGSDLPPPPSDDAAPTFAVTAFADSADGALPLQRVQIIKGVVGEEDDLTIIDVAGGDNGASVDTDTCEPQGDGAKMLCGVWTDPDYDPNDRAFYYVRVLENPRCRWSTHLCNSLPEAEQPENCSNPDIQKTIQERAWTSPIWAMPSE